MEQTPTRTIAIRASDVSGQKTVQASAVPTDASIGELVETFLDKMQLAPNDVEGRPLRYHARLEREGRHLHSSELVGEALQEDDYLVLQPNIDAGGRHCFK
jgi:hypothetical protein